MAVEGHYFVETTVAANHVEEDGDRDGGIEEEGEFHLEIALQNSGHEGQEERERATDEPDVVTPE
ncbi:MAG TPA: hypothetical protein ENN68_00505 [Methanomicrobia archaeon]|nr:hypothetical protein [Methanomicrobia archaeon]